AGPGATARAVVEPQEMSSSPESPRTDEPPRAAIASNAPSAGAAAHASVPTPIAGADELGQAERRLEAVAARSANAHTVAAAVAGAAARRPRRIVFADDIEVNRTLLKRFLAREMPDVECFEACDGLHALALVEAHKPDLVILDLRMPEMDGWQAARRIRELENGRDIPILALSVTASPGVVAHALHSGCNEFIPKPVSDYRGLMDRITHWLRPGEPSGRPLEPSG